MRETKEAMYVQKDERCRWGEEVQNAAEHATQTEAEGNGNGNLHAVEDEREREREGGSKRGRVDAFLQRHPAEAGLNRAYIRRLRLCPNEYLEQRTDGLTLWSAMHLRLLNATYYRKM